MPMKSPLIAAMQQKNTTTANGALSNSSTGSAIVDLFGKGAALRAAPEEEVLRYFAAAFQENSLLAIKVLFYLSDIRGGQGERRLFRLCFRWLADHYESLAMVLVVHIPTYRRWDDVLETLYGSKIERLAAATLARQLSSDIASDRPSLAGKWAPSEQASSKQTQKLAVVVRDAMGLTPRQYRKTLSTLRARIRVVEREMSSNNWSEIDFQRVPSRASMIYKDAFKRHQPERYAKFISKVEKGEAKINASTLYPYDIVRKFLVDNQEDATLEVLWKALPNYLADNPHNGLVVCDVSGSMMGGGEPRPLDVSVSLALYFAERNIGAFRNFFLTFSDNSRLQQVVGATLKERIANLCKAEWGMSTNLQSAFKCILDAGIRNHIKEEDMPDVIYIISDMQFNVAVSDNSLTNLDAIRQRYEQSGYKLPRIVFWCVNAYGDAPITVNDKGVCLVSGCSPSILKSVLGGEVMTPLDVVLQAVNVERYNAIEEALK